MHHPELRRVVIAVPGAFRENEDRYAFFHIVKRLNDRLHTFPRVSAVQEQAVQTLHNVRQDRHFQQVIF